MAKRQPPYLSYESGLFRYYHTTSKDSGRARRVGFTWNIPLDCFVTPFPEVAERMMTPAGVAKAKPLFAQARKRISQAIKESHSVTSTFNPPVPAGETLLPYQRSGVEALLRRGRAVLGDDMGLGKTIETIALYNELTSRGPVNRVLIVCPAHLKYVWLREWEKWGTQDTSFQLVSGRKDDVRHDCDVIIINYEVLQHYIWELVNWSWGLLVLDEVHYIKNAQTTRGECIYGESPTSPKLIQEDGTKRDPRPPLQADRVLALTGTLIENRPIESYNILKYLHPHLWPSRHVFGKRWCGGYQGDFGWVYDGASNMEEFQYRLRAIAMIRRTKANVLPDLPPKIRQVIEVDDVTGGARAIRKEQEIWDRALAALGLTDDTILSEKEFKAVVALLEGGDRLLFDEMAAARHETARVKLPVVLQHLDDVLTSSSKVVCYFWHKIVGDALRERYGDIAVFVDGRTSSLAKNKAELAFQTDPEVKLLCGNTLAAGTGLTLTASAHIVFAELLWVPGKLTQAEDRCHRKGSEGHESLLIQHIVLARSIDSKMVKAIIEKQDTIKTALDDDNRATFEAMMG